MNFFVIVFKKKNLFFFLRYDMHLIITDIATQIPGDIQVIPHNTEKYICVGKKVANTGIRFNFIDSFKFLNCSIEKLASFLPDDKKFIL